MADTEEQRKLQRPPLRSNFDLEPNPFEQSFSSTRTTANESSSSSVTTQSSLKNGQAPAGRENVKDETPKPMLPPLASIASPSDGTFAAWGMSATDMGSLRSGPLSPAMLAGPQSSTATTLAGFDAASFGRTGLTPSTGLTPLVGAPVSFPPPSPNTAAFLAMVSNSTTAANLASSTAATITPNTLSAITGVLNNTAMPQAYQTFAPRSDYGQGGADVAAQVNGLFLLSQAHQELAKREEAQRATTSVEPAMDPQAAGPAAAAQRRATKRKTTDAQAPTPSAPAAAATTTRSTNKKQRITITKSKRGKREESFSDDEDLDDDDDDESVTSPSQLQMSPTSKGPKKPETEEEKRRNFLERNRQAALKCRQRKKAWLSQLQAKVEFLTTENERLNAALLKSSEEINRLTALVNAASVVQPNGAPGAPVSVSMQPSHKGEPQSMPMATVVGGRGYGY
ncbi:hypothetical protein BKA62DRAFT_771341 [Auriculariales sp. MPI-PUGE-AT-0066]|nr:hypothetical protein BKA62DRAFT_771341 [Auriculariales sp. MPI-PUGE-AT-0066]